jgi:hypothetical protein
MNISREWDVSKNDENHVSLTAFESLLSGGLLLCLEVSLSWSALVLEMT